MKVITVIVFILISIISLVIISGHLESNNFLGKIKKSSQHTLLADIHSAGYFTNPDAAPVQFGENNRLKQEYYRKNGLLYSGYIIVTNKKVGDTFEPIAIDWKYGGRWFLSYFSWSYERQFR